LEQRGDKSGALFCPVHKSGKVRVEVMTDQAIMKILKKRGFQTDLEPFSPHDQRRTFISDLLDAGADIATVQKLAGHASVTTTARYDRRGEEAKSKATDLLEIPY
jgi:site-specific recombinase XerD